MGKYSGGGHMTPSELKYQTRETSPYFFTSKTMKFFGDRMSNYGCRSAVVDTYDEQSVQVWELYRKRAVKHGLKNSHYFRKDNFEHCFIAKEA
jgi:hypothetical protein